MRRASVIFVLSLFVLSLLLILCQVPNSYASQVEVVSGSLPEKLHEGEQINFTIEVSDYRYEDTKYFNLETNLLLISDDQPIYDFGELNKYVNSRDRYKQNIALNLSSLPRKDSIRISIAGKAPGGESLIKCEPTDVVITKFQKGKLKLYEVDANGKVVDVKLFELVIYKKEKFDETMQQIRWEELDYMKQEVRKLFDRGMVTDAQNLASQMSNIKYSNHLLLLGIIKIKNSIWLNAIFIFLILVSFIIGYLRGSSLSDREVR